MRTFITALAVLVTLCRPAAADSGPDREVRVLIDPGETVVFTSSRKGLVFRSDSGAMLKTGPLASATIRPHELGLRVNSFTFPVDSVRIYPEDGFIKYRNTYYRGYLRLHRSDNRRKLHVINHLDMEDYLKGVIPGEMPPDWPMEALKAQAVAARTYALYRMQESDNPYYHLVSDTGDQVYKGAGRETLRTNKAVNDTEGITLTYRGNVVPAYYHSTSGTRTEAGEAVFTKRALPYLSSVACPYDRQSPHYHWEVSLAPSKIERMLRKSGLRISGVTGLSAKGFTPSGRLQYVVVETRHGDKVLSAHKFRMMTDPTVVKSTFFRIHTANGRIVLRGRGYGHGVGMCQWGAKGMAENRKNFRDILEYYYPGAELTPPPYFARKE